jgi:beta-xylosidase
MVFLGVRPHGGTPGWHVLGRETFLAPVTWKDGWPVVGEIVSPGEDAFGEPFRDDFDLSEPHPSWISVRDRSAEHCTTKERPGSLTLRARGASLDEPDAVFIGRRQLHHACRARASIDPAQGRGGLAVRLDEQHHYEIEADGGEVRVISRVGSVRAVVATRPIPGGPVVLGVRMTAPPASHDPRGGPDVVSLGVEQPDGTFTSLATLDGRYLSTEVAGGFTGRVIGLYAAEGTVHVDWFDYEPLAP